MRTTPTPLTLLAASAGAPLLVCAALSLVRTTVAAPDAALVLVLLVVGAAATGRRVLGLVAAASGAVWFDFFLTEPFYRLTIADRADVETALLLVAVGLCVTEIAVRGRRQQAEASRRAGYLDGLVSTAGLVAGGDAPTDAVVDTVGQQIRLVLGVDSCVFKPGAPGSHPRLERSGEVTQDGHVLAVDRSGLPVHDVAELPVERAGAVLGRYEIASLAKVAWPTLEQRRVAVTLADQAAGALASSA